MYRKPLIFAAKYYNITRSYSINNGIFKISDEIRTCINEGKPVVALESTIITHGMPFPKNVQCALEVEEMVRAEGAVPATIAILNGVVKVGLSKDDIGSLGDISNSAPVKTSRRDFPYVLSKKLNGGTTVSGTIIACQQAGIPIFATGGIGGVHRGASETFDISADLTELGRSNVSVISSGVKSILDISKTLEYLETQGVFVATLGSSNDFPAFYARSSGCKAPYCVKDSCEAAEMIKAHRDMGLQSGMLFAVPVPEKYALNPEIINKAILEALGKAQDKGISGKDTTPFLLSEIATVTGGNSLETNIALIKNNAKVAAQIAMDLARFSSRQIEVTSMNQPVIIGGSNVDCIAQLDEDSIKLNGGMHMARFEYKAGGVARNMCEALSKLGCDSTFISAIGDDYQGKFLTKQLPLQYKRHILKISGEHTAQCIVVIDKKGDCTFLVGDMNIHGKISANVLKNHEDLIKNSPLVIIDGNLSEEAMAAALHLAKKYNIPVFYEPTDVAIAEKPFTTDCWNSIKFITPNLKELQVVARHFKLQVNKHFDNELEEAAALAKVLVPYIDNVIVTLGPQGVLIARKGEATDSLLCNNLTSVSVRHYPQKILSDIINVSGAGDCFASGFVAAHLKNLHEARCVSVGFAAAKSALYADSPVPNNLFDSEHVSWKIDASFVTL
ncbi:uncharacterized protein LOC126734680 [Anthonomus grandis grandis]|uniref:uncharacterized protein LOC126734680 n=1 Tax=Anthonomus grandis grandis TaxID=2921223 RepID=UPI0021664491|nr:uncharacterized protein LOC126734680 [Anthonomus grandis grandis]